MIVYKNVQVENSCISHELAYSEVFFPDVI